MRLPICGVLVFAMLTAAAPSFGQSTDWTQCADVNNRDAFASALAACNRILKDKREAANHTMALRNRCGIYYTHDDYDKALADCNRAARQEPQSKIVYDRRGLIWYVKKDYNRAIADFDQAIRIDPNYARALYHRGTSKQATGDNAGGDADIARAKEIDPDVDK
ncbi:MAG: tetratricopeptide repeat protein [Rhizobiales bacterium]|nr:tetratricopeptide repeat protein [Hyphomicrobiales bacterium]